MKKKSSNPWKVLSSKLVYKSPFIRIIEDRVITPEGKSGIHNRILGGESSVGGVSVVAIDKKGFVYLVKQYRYAYGGYTLETINGGIDEGENPLESAKRELAEEANLKAYRWEKIAESFIGTESIDIKSHYYLASDLETLDGEHHGENLMKVIKVPLSKAVDLVFKNKIPLTGSALAVLMADRIINT